MRNKPSRRPFVRAVHLALVASMLAIVTPTLGAPHVATAATPTPWTASGPASVTLTSDGSDTDPQMNYVVPYDPQNSIAGPQARYQDQTWTLSTTAGSDGTHFVKYLYTGYHAFFAVRVHLDAFVTHLGVTTSVRLVNEGPVNCCTAPSGGFTYTGSHAFDVVSGDTYGYRVGGFNFDSDPNFSGTVTLTDSPFTDPALVASNTSWTTAATIDPTTGIDGFLTQPGEARWFKFPVQPDSQVQVDLTNLNENFDLTMFRDIGQAFTTLATTQDLTKLSAQFAGDAYSPSIYSPSIYSPSIYSPSIYSPSIYSPSIYSPSIYSPSIYSPSIYSPSIYSPSIYSPSAAFLQAFSSAQTRSLIGVSARENADSESIRTATWNNTGEFYVRVQGRNGAFSQTVNPFHVALTTLAGSCANVLPSSATNGTRILGAYKSVILTDSARIDQTTGLGAKLDQLAGLTNGVVVDVNASQRVRDLNLQADGNAACPYAKNLVAEAIRDMVNSYRDVSGTLKYVVIAGGDSVIPFFRYADSAGIGPESDYIPPARDDSASQASLRRNYVLGQDAYGALSDVTLKGATIPVPDLAVGRLVETPDEIIGMVDAFARNNGVLPTATSSLVTGYDFLTSAADTVQADFAAGLGSPQNAQTLITDRDVPSTTTTVGTPSRRTSWTAADLSTALLGSHHDLVFLAGHFSANSALAADYQTSIASTDLDAHPGVLTDSLVISAGCHAGYNILEDAVVAGLTQPLDWPEAMAKQRATLIAGTGYQYADTDFLAYSAKLYTMLTSQLRRGTGAVAIGDALVNAKQVYLAGVGNLTGIDQKALIESTLYGLPMTGIDLPSGRTGNPTNGAGVTPTPVPVNTPGDQLGLKSATFDLHPSVTAASKPAVDTFGVPTGTLFNWLTGRDGVQSEPALPALPKQIDDVTSTTPGEVLRGVGFRSGTYTDASGVTPLTGAPTTELNGVHTDFLSPVFFPQRLATVNYFGALDVGDGRTRLITTPAQYRSDPPGTSNTNTERNYSQLGLELFYSSNINTYGSNTPALAAPPAVSGVADTVLNSGSDVAISAHVTGDPSAGIQKAWVTYTAESGPLHGAWSSIDLTQDPADSTLWTGTVHLPAGQLFGDVRYIVQGVNGVGLVGVDNNLGAGYTPGVPIGAPTPPTPPNTPPPVPTSIELGPTPVGGATGTTLPVSATLTGAPAGSSVTFSLGSVSSTTTTDGTGHASATLPLQDAVGGYTLTASYPGDATHRSSSATRPFAITKVSTTLSVTPGVSETISATLTRTVSATPLPQQTVIFTIISGLVTEQVAATTDPQGRATIPVGTLSNGAYTVSAQYLGTSTYAPALSGSALVTLAAAGPAVTLLKVTPSSIVVGGTTTLTALVADPSGVSRVEYFVGTDPGVGLATPLTPTLTGTVSAIFGANLPAGTYTVGVRALDRLGIWSAASTTTLTVSQIGVSVSTNANRTGAINLAGATVSGNVAVFATPPAGSSRVAVVGFYIDDPNRNSLPYWIQILSPYDLNGTLKNGTAKLFDTRLLLNGAHTLTVELLRLNGTHERRTVSFTVNNPAPAVAQKLQVSTSATRSNPADLNGRALAGSVAVFVTPTPSVKSVAFWLDKTNLTVLPRSIDSSAQFDFNGTGSNGQAVLFNVGSLAPGSHRIAARVTYTNGTTAVLSSTFTR